MHTMHTIESQGFQATLLTEAVPCCSTVSEAAPNACLQESIRGCDVFLIQPTCPPVNDHLMELMVMIDACKRASARSITAVSSAAAPWSPHPLAGRRYMSYVQPATASMHQQPEVLD